LPKSLDVVEDGGGGELAEEGDPADVGEYSPAEDVPEEVETPCCIVDPAEEDDGSSADMRSILTLSFSGTWWWW
jgi:hypothetical protein